LSRQGDGISSRLDDATGHTDPHRARAVTRTLDLYIADGKVKIGQCLIRYSLALLRRKGN